MDQVSRSSKSSPWDLRRGGEERPQDCYLFKLRKRYLRKRGKRESPAQQGAGLVQVRPAPSAAYSRLGKKRGGKGGKKGERGGKKGQPKAARRIASAKLSSNPEGRKEKGKKRTGNGGGHAQCDTRKFEPRHERKGGGKEKGVRRDRNSYYCNLFAFS